jgi:hypothetical protein
VKRRELRNVRTEARLGSVGLTDEGEAFFTGNAKDVFAAMLKRGKSDEEVVKQLLRDGWSNGYLYLAEGKSRA